MSDDFTLERRKGRLIEARVFRLADRARTDAYSEALARETRAYRAASVLCADHRPVFVYAPEAAARLAELFVQMNARMERVAILVAPSNATLILQLERIVREASFTKRRVFREPGPAVAYLSEGLDAVEAQRAADFLAAYTPKP